MEVFQEESEQMQKAQKEKNQQKRKKEIEVHLSQFNITYENFRKIVPETNGTFEKSDVIHFEIHTRKRSYFWYLHKILS